MLFLFALSTLLISVLASVALELSHNDHLTSQKGFLFALIKFFTVIINVELSLASIEISEGIKIDKQICPD